jgi:hypothetical protein
MINAGMSLSIHKKHGEILMLAVGDNNWGHQKFP